MNLLDELHCCANRVAVAIYALNNFSGRVLEKISGRRRISYIGERQAGGTAVGVAMLVDRSAGAARFTVPAVSLLELSFPTYPADAVPEWLAKMPVEKPGS